MHVFSMHLAATSGISYDPSGSFASHNTPVLKLRKRGLRIICKKHLPLLPHEADVRMGTL